MWSTLQIQCKTILALRIHKTTLMISDIFLSNRKKIFMYFGWS